LIEKSLLTCVYSIYSNIYIEMFFKKQQIFIQNIDACSKYT